MDKGAERGESLGGEGAGGEFRDEAAQARQIIETAEAGARDNYADAGMSKDEFDLVRAIGRIHADEDGAGSRRRILRDQPFRRVRREDRDAVAAFHSERDEGARGPVYFGGEGGEVVA